MYFQTANLFLSKIVATIVLWVYSTSNKIPAYSVYAMVSKHNIGYSHFECILNFIVHIIVHLHLYNNNVLLNITV